MAVKLLNQYDREVFEKIELGIVNLSDAGIEIFVDNNDFKVTNYTNNNIYVHPFNDEQEDGYLEYNITFAGIGANRFYKEIQENIDETYLVISKFETLIGGFCLVDTFTQNNIKIMNATEQTLYITELNGTLIHTINQAQTLSFIKDRFKITNQVES